MGKRARVTFQPDGKRGEVSPGMTVLEASMRLGVSLASICGGRGMCGKCRVVIVEGFENLNPPTQAERKNLSEEELRKGYRLACMARVLGDVVVLVPDESRRGRQRLQVEGVETPVELKPAVAKLTVRLQPPSLEDQAGDAERLLAALESQHGLRGLAFRYTALRKLPTALREGEWTATVTVWEGREIIDVEAGETAGRNYGFAVDVGTTKMAGYLLDLNSGRLLSVSSMMNPQIRFGEDVIARITHAMKGWRELRELHETVVEGLNQMLEDACRKAGVSPEEVYEVVVVGNTAMHHLFLGLNPKFLSLSPYTPVISHSVDVQASKLGVGINPAGNVHVMPVIAGFVGADCVADILATGIHESEELCFLIDIGTNTEIVIGNREGLIAASCASGPAFEGAFIKHGMRAATGAIERVWIDHETMELSYLTIDDAKPRGICGSAIVDLVAEMLKAGIVDTSGRMRPEADPRRVRERGGMLEYVVAWGDETATGEDIAVTQSDIREIQKAKAAMYAGASILMRKLGVDVEDIHRVFMAGAFGNYVDPINAMTIGMLPDFPPEIIRHVGNAAGTGARMALLSLDVRRTAERVHRMVEYVELAAEPEFEREYMAALYLPHLDLRRFPRAVERLRGYRLTVAPEHGKTAKSLGF